MIDHPFLSRALPPKRIEYRDGNTQIVLRPFDAGDAEQFEQAMQASLPSLYRFMRWPDQEWNFSECLHWVIKRHAEYFSEVEFEWGCFDLNTGQLLGSLGMMRCTPFNPDCFEMGFWISDTHQNKGIATLAAKILTLVAFDCLQIKRLQVGHAQGNDASKRVLEKCGFLYEGTLRGFAPTPSEERIKKGAIVANKDHLYALLPDDIKKFTWPNLIRQHLSITPYYGN
jgi:ribosomal-protein-serine acetyltransferase